MSWTNYHTHCYLCDGVGEPQHYVDQALKRGAKGLGFSSHAPVPFPNSWTMQAENLALYCQLIDELRQTRPQGLPVFLGLEIDYIPAVMSPQDVTFRSIGLDYIIGAVHFVGANKAGVPWTVDGDPQSFARGLKEIYQGDIRTVVELYYTLVREMVETACPDVIAHLDLIKKNNPKEMYFSETESWYKTAVFDTLETIAASGAILEVNTGGIVRKRTDTLYPSSWILEQSLALAIPITLSSDAHQPDHVTAGFEDAAGVLREVGFETLHILGTDGWQPCLFSPAGLHSPERALR